MAAVSDPRPIGLTKPVVFRELALTGSGEISSVPSAPTLSVGSGSPNGSLTRPQGSLYLRTDGAGSTTIYVNTDGATTWAASAATGAAGSLTITDGGTYFATDTVDGAVDALAVQIGGDTDTTFNFTEANVLADNDAVYAALEKLDLFAGDVIGIARQWAMSALSAEAANVRSTQVTLQDVEGTTVLEAVQVDVEVWDDAAMTIASTNGTVAVGTNGTALSGDGTNAAVMTFNAANGLLDLDVTNAVGADDHWISVRVTAGLATANVNKVFGAGNFVTGTWT